MDFKGLNVVRQLCLASPTAVTFVFIGTSQNEIGVQKKNVFYTGRYSDHAHLQKLVEDFDVNLTVFPSICPETFSFTISELMAMDLPIISFDIGAQGERVALYKKGVVVKRTEELIGCIKFLVEKKIVSEANIRLLSDMYGKSEQ